MRGTIELLAALVTASAAYRLPTTRRATLQQAATFAATVGSGVVSPAFADETTSALPRLSRPQVNGKLSKIPVVALVNAEDAPFLTGGNGKIGYFFLS